MGGVPQCSAQALSGSNTSGRCLNDRGDIYEKNNTSAKACAFIGSELLRPLKTSDVLIVGGGVSGVMVARSLLRRGMKVRLLEAGGAPFQKLPSDPVKFQKIAESRAFINKSQWPYKSMGQPYDWQRVRSLGGRSLLWGGWSLRPEPATFTDAKNLGSPWPFGLEELAPYLKAAEKILGVQEGAVGPYFKKVERRLGKKFYAKRVALHSQGMRPRNALDLCTSKYQITTGAVALEVLTKLKSGQNRVEALRYFDTRSGHDKILKASRIVVCASAIETARLILSSPSLPSKSVGEGLTDHLLSSGLLLCPGLKAQKLSYDRWKTTSVYIPRWSESWPFIVEVQGPLPASELLDSDLERLGLTAKEAKGMAYFSIHALGETQRHKNRRVVLGQSSHAKDIYGRAIPEIHWAWGQRDRQLARRMNEALKEVAAALATGDCSFVQIWNPLSAGGISHEAGTCSMGDSIHSVVDSWGRVRGVEGLTLADASIMPSALDRHPTLTVAALALRSGHNLKYSD